MVICGKTAGLLVRLNPSLYRPYIWYTKKGVPMLYVRLERALCGMMLRAVLLFYRKLWADLEDIGFEVNPYDQRVANNKYCGWKPVHSRVMCGRLEDLAQGGSSGEVFREGTGTSK